MTAPVTAPTTATLSGIITNLDATPIVRASAGSGAAGHVQRLFATITPTASQATSVLNRLVRIPSNAIVTRVAILLDTVAGSSGLLGNVGLWYSDDPRDGTNVNNAGNLTAISSAFFASLLNMQGFAPVCTSGVFTKPTDGTTIASSFGPVDITFANTPAIYTDGSYLPSQAGNPIWLAVANSLALLTTPVGAFTQTSQQPHFNTASAGASVYVRSDDPGGYFDICLQLTTSGTTANQKVNFFVDVVVPG